MSSTLAKCYVHVINNYDVLFVHGKYDKDTIASSMKISFLIFDLEL
jgi:hypothetical protein